MIKYQNCEINTKQTQLAYRYVFPFLLYNANNFLQRDRYFEKIIKRKGFIIKKMEEDGACLFRAVADQVYGDQEMHTVVRNHCMDYIVS